MSDTSNYYGDVVNVHGGERVIGIYHNTAPDTELRAAVADLTRLLGELRPVLSPDQARTVDDALPALTPDRAALRERGMILASVSQIAAIVGEVGRPVMEALGRLLALLG
ncbi:hypothetical protein ACF1HU_15950 [Streptomyces olivaceus]|uniref:hypothetical protein n=1 Tax=Streptomyces olivaceus TaxID=47716 RepID=UPI0004CAAE0E|nr:hypothetical protein [Streptomyces olivaceus]MBZ6100998.1 hypothetical protein [Streptomyces olivaceus]MBZ6192283.1 hypothetical protein [Streptomyces olivaceus]MBZ6199803.1 hypothetical protein [Streptomyces olivaceus]MBZ6304904.1 hypothetical protein [Streptomyces olivaceus]MBZ6317832.1 hypothetical protein [Streptomyces olivaceus]